MRGRTHGKVWLWSLLAACILTGIFSALTAIGPFLNVSGISGPSFSLTDRPR
jgi:hypothetical protein